MTREQEIKEWQKRHEHDFIRICIVGLTGYGSLDHDPHHPCYDCPTRRGHDPCPNALCCHAGAAWSLQR